MIPFIFPLKAIVHILLIVLITAQTIKSVLVFVAFKWNQNKIALTLCENKTRPELKCDGKCYLRKQINKQQKSKDTPLIVKRGQSFDFFVEQEVLEQFFVIPEFPIKIVASTQKCITTHLTLVSRLVVSKLFRPPALF